MPVPLTATKASPTACDCVGLNCHGKAGANCPNTGIVSGGPGMDGKMLCATCAANQSPRNFVKGSKVGKGKEPK